MKAKKLIGLGLLAAFLLMAVSLFRGIGAKADEARSDITKSKMDSIEFSLASYHEAVGDLPADLGSLASVCKQKGIPVAPDFSDAWGNAIVYERLKGLRFRIRSRGPDKALDSADDIFDTWDLSRNYFSGHPLESDVERERTRRP